MIINRIYISRNGESFALVLDVKKENFFKKFLEQFLAFYPKAKNLFPIEESFVQILERLQHYGFQVFYTYKEDEIEEENNV